MPKVLVLYASESDAPVFDAVKKILKAKNVDFDERIASAHRTPQLVDDILEEEDYAVVIAGAGLAAHLPGVIAAKTIRPVIGVPCSGNYEGLDALLSIMQMPPGIPVLGVGVGKSGIAAENAVKILKEYEFVNLVGDKSLEALRKAEKILKDFKIDYEINSSLRDKAVNIEFVSLDEEPEQRKELVIFCPMLDKKDDKAEAAINLLKRTHHGLWVGLNRGDNAAIAAIEIMNLDDAFRQKILDYRKKMKKKIEEANKVL